MTTTEPTPPNPTPTQALPGWWQREKQKRQARTLIFLLLVLALIGFFKYESDQGKIGKVQGITFDTTRYVAFIRRDKDGSIGLYAVRADGTDLRRLSDANDKSDKQAPAWTMDGKSLLYVSNRDDAQVRQIYLLGEGEPKQLTSGRGRMGSGNKDLPVPAPDGKHCAFVAQGAIKTVLLNGNDQYQILPPPQAGNDPNADNSEGTNPGVTELHGPFLAAAYSSDGSAIAGVQEVSGEESTMVSGGLGDQVARVLPAGANAALFLDSGREVSISWEPNGQRLACSFTEMEAPTENGKKEIVSGIRIWRFPRPNKGEPSNVFAGVGYSVTPKNIAWSPDGTRMAFENWRLKSEGNRELRGITVIDVTSNGVIVRPQDADNIPNIVAVSREGRPQHPRWSPDGAKLCYEMERPDGGHDVWSINADGTNPVNLTGGKGDNVSPAWSPVVKK